MIGTWAQECTTLVASIRSPSSGGRLGAQNRRRIQRDVKVLGSAKPELYQVCTFAIVSVASCDTESSPWRWGRASRMPPEDKRRTHVRSECAFEFEHSHKRLPRLRIRSLAGNRQPIIKGRPVSSAANFSKLAARRGSGPELTKGYFSRLNHLQAINRRVRPGSEPCPPRTRSLERGKSQTLSSPDCGEQPFSVLEDSAPPPSPITVTQRGINQIAIALQQEGGTVCIRNGSRQK